MEETIQFAPERRRGEQQARFGMGPSRMIGIPGEFKQLSRRRMTPSELASWKLNQALMKYPEFTADGRQLLQDEFVNMPGLRTMNMKVLAATLSFLNSLRGREYTADSFKDDYIMPYIKELLPLDVGSVERKRLIIRFKAQLLIYIEAIENFRANQ
jgi:hypothetical protein